MSFQPVFVRYLCLGAGRARKKPESPCLTDLSLMQIYLSVLYFNIHTYTVRMNVQVDDFWVTAKFSGIKKQTDTVCKVSVR